MVETIQRVASLTALTVLLVVGLAATAVGGGNETARVANGSARVVSELHGNLVIEVRDGTCPGVQVANHRFAIDTGDAHPQVLPGDRGLARVEFTDGNLQLTDAGTNEILMFSTDPRMAGRATIVRSIVHEQLLCGEGDRDLRGRGPVYLATKCSIGCLDGSSCSVDGCAGTCHNDAICVCNPSASCSCGCSCSVGC